MKLEDYPPQEPLSALGRAYQERVLAAGAGVVGAEFAYGDDPYQGLSVHRAPKPTGVVLLPHDAAPAASPLLRLDREVAAPFLLAWGSRDFPHLVTQAGQMAKALRAAGVPVETHVLEGCDHFEASLACGDARSGWPAAAAAWMQAVGQTNRNRPGGQP